jgi:hypothetical protein
LCFQPNGNKIISARHSVHVGRDEKADRSLVGNLKGRSHLKDLDVDEKMVLKKLDASLGWINLI